MCAQDIFLNDMNRFYNKQLALVLLSVHQAMVINYEFVMSSVLNRTDTLTSSDGEYYVLSLSKSNSVILSGKCSSEHQ